MTGPDDSGEHPRLASEHDGPEDASGDASSTAPTAAAGEDDSSAAPSRPQPRPLLDEPEFQRFARVIRIFLWPFFFSWAVAFAGSARGIDWLHFTGLGGVLVCMLALLVWLIS